jgi:hypothetical protein
MLASSSSICTQRFRFDRLLRFIRCSPTVNDQLAIAEPPAAPRSASNGVKKKRSEPATAPSHRQLSIAQHPVAERSGVDCPLSTVHYYGRYNLFSPCIVTHDRALMRVFSARLIHTPGSFGEHHHNHTPSLPESRIRESINTCFRQIISVPSILIVIKPLTAAGLRAAGGRARGTSSF